MFGQYTTPNFVEIHSIRILRLEHNKWVTKQIETQTHPTSASIPKFRSPPQPHYVTLECECTEIQILTPLRECPNTRAVWKVRGLSLILRVGTLWMCGDGFFELLPLASDALTSRKRSYSLLKEPFLGCHSNLSGASVLRDWKVTWMRSPRSVEPH
jgi:hypothetical protein